MFNSIPSWLYSSSDVSLLSSASSASNSSGGISDALSSSKSLEAGFIQDWFSSVNSTASLLKLSSLSATQKAMNRCQQQVIE
jgi:hypothetical protein